VTIETTLDANPRAGDEIPIVVDSRTFYGAPADGEALGITVQVLRDLEVLPGKVQLTKPEEGVQRGTFLAEEPGSYKFVVRMGDREVTTTTVMVLGGSDNGTNDDGINIYIYYTLGAVILLVIALVLGLRHRS
jgi:hypothetical protein